MLKRILVALPFIASAHAGIDPLDYILTRCSPENVLYYGESTKDSMNALVCINYDKVVLTVTNTASNKTKVIEVPKSQTEPKLNEGPTSQSTSLVIRDGDALYQIGNLVIPRYNVDESYLAVYANGISIKRFVFDTDKTINGIKSNFKG